MDAEPVPMLYCSMIYVLKYISMIDEKQSYFFLYLFSFAEIDLKKTIGIVES